MLFGLYFVLVIALPLALGSYVVYNGLPRTRRCPVCADETLRLRSLPHAVANRLLRSELQRRWCTRCGWHGSARLAPAADPRAAAQPAVATRPPRSGLPGEPGAAGHRAHGGRAERVDLRSVEVDGDTWRVMMECWAEEGRWVASLVFEAPGGRVCTEERSIEGDSALSVISEACRLPEQALAGRVRRSIH